LYAISVGKAVQALMQLVGRSLPNPVSRDARADGSNGEMMMGGDPLSQNSDKVVSRSREDGRRNKRDK
jgi:hypothetical protein